MALIPIEEFGFPNPTRSSIEPLVIPRSAPLITGRRSVVYVEMDADDTSRRYEGREVLLGPRVGDHYVVLDGLRPGERVVTRGAFKIDSAMQIQAKPSMMNPDADAQPDLNELSTRPTLDAPNPNGLSSVISPYLSAMIALSDDDTETALLQLRDVRNRLEAVMSGMRSRWHDHEHMHRLAAIRSALENLPEDLEGLRIQFRTISDAFRSSLEAGDYHGSQPLYLTHCPMAFDGEGGYWIQDSKTISNPYYGDVMLRCGTIEGRFGGASSVMDHQ
jgi:Cu(I)/Ag(I) efflux system membrane fusion protein